MPDPTTKTSPPPADSEQVIEAVSFFEQILQTMPEDRVSLEVLSQAYEQAGDAAKASDLLIRLARVVERDGDMDAARALKDRLIVFAGTQETDAALEQLARFVTERALTVSGTAKPAQTAGGGQTAGVPSVAEAMQLVNGPSERRAIVTQELDFAWMLHEQNLLSEDQYASVVSDITDLSASATPLPISVLHLFQDRQLPNIDRVLAFASEKSGVPQIPLGSFDPQLAAFRLLPIDYLVIKGVVPFELMSNDLLVGALNPLNEKLREEIERLTGRRCHFFLVQPSEFDSTLDKIRKALQAPDAAKPK